MIIMKLSSRLMAVCCVRDRWRWLMVIGLPLFCGFAANSAHAETVHITSDLSRLNISSAIQLLSSDPGITSAQIANQFYRQGRIAKVSFTDTVSTPVSNVSQWLRIDIQFDSALLRERQWVLTTGDVMHLVSLQLHVPVIVDGQTQYVAFQDALHDQDGLRFGTTNSDFYLPLNIDDSQPLWLEVSGKLPLSAKLYWVSSQHAQLESVLRVAVYSLLFGAVLSLIGYNFVLYFFVRDIAYLLYVGYAVALGLYLSQVSGYMFLLSPKFGLFYYQHVTSNFSAGIACLLGAMFTSRFLNLQEKNRLYAYFILFIAGLTFLIGVSSYFIETSTIYYILHKTQFLLASLTVVLAVLPTVVMLRAGSFFALPFMVAWGALGTGVVLMTLRHTPVLFGIEFGVYTNVLIGMTVEMILMSYGLGYRFRTMRRENKQLERLTRTDPLTGLFNHRYYNQRLQNLIENTGSNDQQWALAVIDVDHFKKFNDEHGHLIGDRVLAELGKVITANSRDIDSAFRVGGEEFVLLMKVRKIDDAIKIVERIRLQFAQTEISSIDDIMMQCSLSAGVTLIRPDDTNHTCIHRADKAMYQAKAQGRNRVVIDVELDLDQNLATQ